MRPAARPTAPKAPRCSMPVTMGMSVMYVSPMVKGRPHTMPIATYASTGGCCPGWMPPEAAITPSSAAMPGSMHATRMMPPIMPWMMLPPSARNSAPTRKSHAAIGPPGLPSARSATTRAAAVAAKYMVTTMMMVESAWKTQTLTICARKSEGTFPDCACSCSSNTPHSPIRYAPMSCSATIGSMRTQTVMYRLPVQLRRAAPNSCPRALGSNADASTSTTPDVSTDVSMKQLLPLDAGTAAATMLPRGQRGRRDSRELAAPGGSSFGGAYSPSQVD